MKSYVEDFYFYERYIGLTVTVCILFFVMK